MIRLTYDFYNRHPVDVAKELLGKKFIFGHHEGIITETEAYRDRDDEASHAYRGITKRNAVMFGLPGHLYVYFIYGMYHCVNIVTEGAGQASAVLIRGLKLSDIHLDGPGKLCRHLGITKHHEGMNLVNSKDVYVTDGVPVDTIITTPRIGITKAMDKPWRFVMDPRAQAI